MPFFVSTTRINELGQRQIDCKNALRHFSLSQSAVHCRSHDYEEMTIVVIKRTEKHSLPSSSTSSGCQSVSNFILGHSNSLSNRKRMVSTLCCGFKKLLGSSHSSNLDEGYPSRDENAISCKFEFMCITIHYILRIRGDKFMIWLDTLDFLFLCNLD